MGVHSDDIIAKLRALPGLTSAHEISQLLGLKKATIYKFVRLNLIPCYRVGYSIRFDPTAVAAWLEGKQL